MEGLHKVNTSVWLTGVKISTKISVSPTAKCRKSSKVSVIPFSTYVIGASKFSSEKLVFDGMGSVGAN